mgnify:CR=1 FL=1
MAVVMESPLKHRACFCHFVGDLLRRSSSWLGVCVYVLEISRPAGRRCVV